MELIEAGLRLRVRTGPTPDWLLRPGRAECGPAWRRVRLIYRRLTGGLELPEIMPVRETRAIDGILGGRRRPLRIIEIDESQHFNPFRAVTLRLYDDVPVAFPRETWIAESEEGSPLTGGGWAAPRPPLFPSPGGRNLQRAFRDALADILPPLHGYAPTLRVADFEIRTWMYERGAAVRMRRLVEERIAIASISAGECGMSDA